MDAGIDLKANKKPIAFGGVAHAAIHALESKFPEISMSLRNDKRGTFLKSVLNAYNSLLNAAEKKTVLTVDDETERKKKLFNMEKRKMFLAEAPLMTIAGKGDVLVPQPVSNALRSLDVYNKIPVDQHTSRLLAPLDPVVKYRGKEIPTYYENGNQKFLSPKMLSGLVIAQKPWNTRLETPELHYQINRIPEVKVIRAYIKHGTSEKFYDEVSKIQKNFAKLKNPTILGRRLASQIKKIGKIANASAPSQQELLKYMVPSDYANYSTFKNLLTPENLNDVDEYKYQKFGSEFRGLLERGKLTQNAKTELAKQLQIYPKDVAETYIGRGI